MLVEKDPGYYGEDVKLNVFLTKESMASLKHVYPILEKINMYWNSDMTAFEGTVLPLLEAIIKEAEK